MKIVHINWRAGLFGGGEVYLHQLCDLQEAAGHEVAILSDARYRITGSGGGGRQHYYVDGSMGFRSGRKEKKRVLDILARVRPDLVHLHQTGYLLSPMIVKAIQQQLPTVKTIHDVGIVCPKGDKFLKICRNRPCTSAMGLGCILRRCYSLSPHSIRHFFFTLWEKRVAQGCDKILLGSGYMRQELVRNGFAESGLEVVPLFTSIRETGGVVGTQLPGARKLLFVGRIEPSKGIFAFINTLKEIRRQEWSAEVIGEGPSLVEAKQRVVQLGLEGRVRFHGMVKQDAMAAFYAGAFLVVMPSLIPESFGLVGIEAMAFGKPVVAFCSGGITEWLRHEETGFLVEWGNVHAMAGRISELLADQVLSQKMAKNALARFEHLYRQELHLKRLGEIYGLVVKK